MASYAGALRPRRCDLLGRLECGPHQHVRAIAAIDHPEGSGTLTLREKVRLPDGKWQRNGVGYLRTRFLRAMRDEGWRAEGDVDLARDRQQPPIQLYPSREAYREPITSEFGEFDLVTTAAQGTRMPLNGKPATSRRLIAA